MTPLHNRAEFVALSRTLRAHFSVSVTDPEGRIIDVNEAFCELSGYARDELIGQTHRLIQSGHHPPAFFAEMWSTIAAGQSWQGEVCNRTKDNRLYWVDCIITPIANEQGVIERHVSLRRDITARKQQEDALERSRALLSRVGELAHVGGWELDLPSGTISWGDETCRIHGQPPGYCPSVEDAIAYYTPEGQAVVRAAIGDTIRRQSLLDVEVSLVRADGRTIWVHIVGSPELEDGRVVRIVGGLQDVTERVEQRRAIEAVNERVALATDSGGIGIWDYDAASSDMGWDAWMFRLYGLPAQSGRTVVPYDDWRSFVHPDDLPATERAIQAVFKGHEAALDIEFRIRRHDGELRYIHSAARVARDAHGRTVRMIGVNWDVTDLRQLSAQLADKHELLQVTLQSIGDAVITTDAQCRVTWLNPVAERMTGWHTAEALGRPLGQVFHFIHEDTRVTADSPVEECLRKGSVTGLAKHTVLISRDGTEYGVEDSAAPIRNTRGELMGAVLVFHDVTEQRRLSGEMNYRATHDALTGLVNRGEFETRLRRALQRAHEDASEHALMYIDLDQFKLVNDACGHSAGDLLLKQVSKLLKDTVRSRDTLARLGGDEFAVILENCTTSQAQRVAQKICDRMDEFRFMHDGRRFRIGASIGLVPVDRRWGTMALIMQAADTACYAAKEGGRNRVHAWFDTDAALRARQGEMQWATRLEQALDDDRFVLFAQRIEPIQGQSPGCYAEVLLRLRDDNGGLVAPGLFLPAAERFNLATRIDRWVLVQAFERLRSVSVLQGIDTLCINVSGQSIGDRAFHRHAIDILRAAGSEVCSKVCLEITETAAVTNLADASLFIEQARKLGVRIALDDFGAGASSFGYLRSLPVDILKIDGQFIKDLTTNPLHDAAVRCFVDVARVVGVRTVAEFVDSTEVLERIRLMGVDRAQGFLLHRPEPIENVLGLRLVRR